MNKNILLTIGVPTYNGSKTIANMLEIMLPQVTNEVEVLISDNCSNDGTYEIVNNYCKQYPEIRYIRNEKNLGADVNFLQCMKEASGKFVMLISDDDIIVEGAVSRILNYLRQNSDITLAYMESVAFKQKYENVKNCHTYKYLTSVEKDKFTYDKKEFLHYCQRLFGFTSSHIWSTSRVKEINNPEKFFGTYFLQAYICILCSNKPTDKLGIISGPCIAVGEYGIIGNYDMAKVEGVYYKKMLNYAVKNGYPQKALDKYYSWKLRHLIIRNIVKEKVAGVKKTKKESVIKATENLPFLRAFLISLFYIPSGICKLVLTAYRKLNGVSTKTYVNRPTD